MDTAKSDLPLLYLNESYSVREDRKREGKADRQPKCTKQCNIHTRVNLTCQCFNVSQAGDATVSFLADKSFCVSRKTSSKDIFNMMWIIFGWNRLLKLMSTCLERGCHSQYIGWIVNIFDFDQKYNKGSQWFSISREKKFNLWRQKYQLYHL